MKTAIGIDIGGTKISIVLGNTRGKILAQKILPTLTGKKTRQAIGGIIEALRALKNETGTAKISGIGIGIPGPVNSEKGIVPRSPHLGGWAGIPLQKILERELELPVCMVNDADAAALGEKYFGQGKNIPNFIYLTVSTGIGSGIVVNGQLVQGSNYVAGEVGHMTIVPNGERCKCGKRGCLEAYASGTAIADFAIRGLKEKKFKRSALFEEKEPLSARIVGQAARKGNGFAIQIYEKAGYFLGIGIANLLNILNPEKVILGGGVWKSAPPQFWNTMMQSCKHEAWPQAMKSVWIVKSKLQGYAGDLGALALVFEVTAKIKKKSSN